MKILYRGTPVPHSNCLFWMKSELEFRSTQHNVRGINSLVFKNMDKHTLFNDYLRIKVDGL